MCYPCCVRQLEAVYAPSRAHFSNLLALAVVATVMATLSFSPVSQAQQAEEDRFAAVAVSAQQVAGSVYMLTGAGGNIAASIGADGTLIVDDQFAPLHGRIQTVLDKLGGSKPKLILNTHYHGDHAGGNALFGEAGTIIAHDNVRQRLLADDELPRSALPVVTFGQHLQVHFNDETIRVMHLPSGHTDGDSAVWFVEANVIHMGDQLFNGRYPYVDAASGGSVDGYIANLAAILDQVPDDIQVIPGHGPLGGIEALREAHELIAESVALIRETQAQGRSDRRLIKQLDKRYPKAGSGFIDAKRWVDIVRSSPQN